MSPVSIASKLILVLVSAAFLVMLYSQFYKPISEDQTSAGSHVKEYQLLDVMHELQTYSTKLYFAGLAQNKELASWYAWKIEHAILNIQQGKIEPYAYNGWDAAELTKMLDKPITELNKSIDEENWGEFALGFDWLLDSCNACHSATEHDFIVVLAPKGERPPQNQKFD